MVKEQISLEESLKRKAKILSGIFSKVKSPFSSPELKIVLILLVVALFSIFLVFYAQGYRISFSDGFRIFVDSSSLPGFERLNDYCITFGNEMTQYFLNETNSSYDLCNCYYEVNKTGNPTLDSATTPLCTCNCSKNGASVLIGLRR